MKVERTTVIALIDEVLAILDEGASAEEKRAGWSPENRRIVTKVLAKLLARLEDPHPIRPGEVRPSLSRDIDDLGIDEGDLRDQIARISILSNAAR